jgi:hypothetical protein
VAGESVEGLLGAGGPAKGSGVVVLMASIVAMPGPTAARALPVGRARTLAQVYRHVGEVEAADTSPLYQRVAVALSASEEALGAIEAAPAGRRHPRVILAGRSDLALAGRARVLAAASGAGDGEAAASAAIDTLVGMTDSVVAIAARRRPRTNQSGRCAVLYPAIAQAARRVATLGRRRSAGSTPWSSSARSAPAGAIRGCGRPWRSWHWAPGPGSCNGWAGGGRPGRGGLAGR